MSKLKGVFETEGEVTTIEKGIPIPVTEAKGEEALAIEKEYGAVTSAKSFPEFSAIDFLSVDKEIVKHLDKLGLVSRLINWPLYRSQSNMHRQHWRPYIFPKEVKENKDLHWIGQINAEGLLRRGDLVLAVRPKTMHEEAKRALSALNQRYRSHEGQKATEFKEFAKERGLKTDVISTGSVTTIKR